MPDIDDDQDVEIRDFEFDTWNTQHLARHGVRPATVWDVWFDRPVVIQNKEDATGTHLMIGEDTVGVLWTIAILLMDDETMSWRPITGFPTEHEDEERSWRDAN